MPLGFFSIERRLFFVTCWFALKLIFDVVQ